MFLSFVGAPFFSVGCVGGFLILFCVFDLVPRLFCAGCSLV